MKKWLILVCALLLFWAPAALAEEGEAVPMEGVWDEEEELLLEDVSSRVLTLGSEGDDVRHLQTRLTELEYYAGEVSGSFGEATRSALEFFQDDFGLAVTGEADGETQAVLFAALYRPLRLGSQGNLVKNVQVRLMALGYYTGKISGNYLSTTQEAVQDFQERNALLPTGDADVDTQMALFDNDARRKSDKALPTVTPVPETDDFLVIEDSDLMPTPAPTVAYVKQLKYGVTGKTVKTLQQRLVDLGFYEGPVSGNYLGHTRNAVKAFQEHNALEIDGIVGEDTWNAIFNDPDVALPGDPPKATPEPTPVPFAITVDVTNQVTTVYGRDNDGNYTVVVRQMLCSTGTKGYPSDVGDWVLSGRTARWCYFPKWGGHAQYWTKINKSIAFHSVVYNSVDTMDLSISSYKNLGKRASHGCIRLTVADARWIYENCGEGVVVTITEKLPKDPELRASLKLPALNKANMLPYVTAQPTAEPTYISGAQPPLPLKNLRKNDSSEAVFWLQSKLKELGYYGGKVSGTYLDGTVNAVKAFQKANGLYADGIAGVKTLEVLYAQELATPTPEPTATPAPETIVPETTVSPTPAP